MKRYSKCIICLILALLMSFSQIPLAGQAEFCVEAAQKKTSRKKTDKKKSSKKKKYHLNKTLKHLNKRATFILKVSGGAKKVKWSSGNKKVATVKAKSKRSAVVRAKSPGICRIYAKIDKVTLTCTIQVTEVPNKAGTFKNGAFYVGKQKIYSVKNTLSAPTGIKSFHGARYLYIGASRTKNTEDAVKDADVYFYSYPGCGIESMFRRMYSDSGWKEAGLRVIDGFLKQRPTGMVLIDPGANDVQNIKAYISLYKTLIHNYPAAKFRFISILPRESGSNKKRIRFNRQLKKALSAYVIDLYSFVWSHPMFDTTDGTHYGPLLSRIVYERTMKAAGRSIHVDLGTGVVSDVIIQPVVPPVSDEPVEEGETDGENIGTEEEKTEQGPDIEAED